MQSAELFTRAKEDRAAGIEVRSVRGCKNKWYKNPDYIQESSQQHRVTLQDPWRYSHNGG